jgi:hypothetical protein
MRAKRLTLVVATVLCIAGALSVSLWHASASDCSKISVGFVPLNDLGAALYRGKQGGLYPNGSNLRPLTHENAGLQIAKGIAPLNPSGQSDPNGRVVLVSIGMSNTTQEFSTFIPVADADPAKNPKLTIVDGAQGGMSANRIVDLSTTSAQQFWTTVDQRLAAAGVTPAQVQIAWVKQADPGPTLQFPDDALKLKGELATIAQILKSRFPNIKIAYYSSRIYAGYATTNLNPEPFAYQSGFAVKWLIEDQINGSPDLNFDAARGAVKVPWLAWGPYLWADGMTARSDGLTWSCSDLQSDGTHPAPNGAREKVANMLLNFFKTDGTAWRWFVNPQSTTNPIDDAQFFVRAHYLDFLSREPDASGLSFWTDQITSCGTDQSCIEGRRINDSAAFYLSIEFQQTGYLAYRIYRASYGNLPNAPVPIKFDEFLPDTQKIGQGVVVNQAGWESVLENNKQAFAAQFVQRLRFTAAYPTSMTPDMFVDTLFANAAVVPSSGDRAAAINEFSSATTSSDAAARGRALRRVAENSTLANQEFNKAFVLMQYFGYLRRNPNDPPEPGLNFDGYDFWLTKLNQFNGNFVEAEMVKAFIISGEYRQRFGP